MEQNIQEEIERVKKLVERWEQFKTPDDIPCYVPSTTEEVYKLVVVPKLTDCGGIPKDKLVVGKTYIGSCRNSEEAVWDGEWFRYERYKFGSHFIDKVRHFEDDHVYDVFVPLMIKD